MAFDGLFIHNLLNEIKNDIIDKRITEALTDSKLDDNAKTGILLVTHGSRLNYNKEFATELYNKLISEEINDAEKCELRDLTKEIGSLPLSYNSIDFLYDDFIKDCDNELEIIKKIREEMGNATELGAELKEANKRKLRKITFIQWINSRNGT